MDRLFAALADDAARARMAPAEAVRRRADHRAAVRTVLACVAVAVLVAGTAVGSGWALGAGDPSRPPPAPADSGTPTTVRPPTPRPGTPTPMAPTTRPPASPPSSAPAPPIPSTVPDRAFLQAADTYDTGPQQVPDLDRLPPLCGAEFGADASAGVQRTAQLIYRGPDTPAGYVPNGTVNQTIAVYRGTGAREFLDQVRAAVRDCPEQVRGEATYRHRLLDPVPVGDESVLFDIRFESRYVPEQPAPDRLTSLVSLVRLGDTVTVLFVQGWENSSADGKEVAALTRKAADRLAAWRR